MCFISHIVYAKYEKICSQCIKKMCNQVTKNENNIRMESKEWQSVLNSFLYTYRMFC